MVSPSNTSGSQYEQAVETQKRVKIGAFMEKEFWDFDN